MKSIHRSKNRIKIILPTAFIMLCVALVPFEQVISNPINRKNLKSISISSVDQKTSDSATTSKSRIVSSIQTEAKLPNTSSFSVENFDISIPAINLSHEVKFNVDPRYKDIYMPVLDKYVAHGKFTKLPSRENGRVYLFAHSLRAPKGITPQGGYFSHINLLDKGDKIHLNFNGDRFTYKVRESRIVEPTEVEYYTGRSDRAEVTLQACYPPGTTDKRILVFGDLFSVK